jgi:hypothetical protein
MVSRSSLTLGSSITAYGPRQNISTPARERRRIPHTHQNFGVVGPLRRAVHPRVVRSSLGRWIHRLLRHILFDHDLIILLPLIRPRMLRNAAQQEQRAHGSPAHLEQQLASLGVL